MSGLKGPKPETIEKYHLAAGYIKNEAVTIEEACKKASLTRASFFAARHYLGDESTRVHKTYKRKIITEPEIKQTVHSFPLTDKTETMQISGSGKEIALFLKTLAGAN